MPDNVTKRARSKIMAAVKSIGNKSTEGRIVVFFRTRKINGWRRNLSLYGRPDFVFPYKRIVVFADGCFWHGHNCRNVTPKTNKRFWHEKIIRNQARDQKVNMKLRASGWHVYRLWECAIAKAKYPNKLLKLLTATNKIKARGK